MFGFGTKKDENKEQERQKKAKIEKLERSIEVNQHDKKEIEDEIEFIKDRIRELKRMDADPNNYIPSVKQPEEVKKQLREKKDDLRKWERKLSKAIEELNKDQRELSNLKSNGAFF